jgi:hypothetical protein
MRRVIIPALLLILLSVVLGATVFREQVAQAAATLMVREQNTDANGNIKVHEQGTAAVHVNNLPATQAVTISGPANSFSYSVSLGAATEGFGVLRQDSAGARYAISGVTLAAPDDTPASFTLIAEPQQNGTCQEPGGTGEKLITLVAPAHDTASASLPQPFVSDSSGAVCLDYLVGLGLNNGELDASVVGYVIP